MRGPKLSLELLEDIRRTERLNRDEIVRRELRRREAEAAARPDGEAPTLTREEIEAMQRMARRALALRETRTERI